MDLWSAAFLDSAEHLESDITPKVQLAQGLLLS